MEFIIGCIFFALYVGIAVIVFLLRKVDNQHSSESSERKPFKIHLSTLIALTLFAGLWMWANFSQRSESYDGKGQKISISGWPFNVYFIDGKPDLSDEFDQPKLWLNYYLLPLLIALVIVPFEWWARQRDEVAREFRALEETRRK